MPTVDLRFMVYDSDQIKKATGYMLELNAASKDRVVAHDKEGHAMKRAMTATEKYNRLSTKLLKIRTKDAEQGHMTAKQLDDQFEKHQRILRATESTLKDYVQTDRVAITQQRRKQKIIADSIKATVKYNNETEKLRDKFDSMGAATRRYEKAQKDIIRAFGHSESEIKLSKIALAALTAEYKEFRNAHEAGGIINAGNQFARYGDQAYRAQQKIKRFRSVGLQQVGYQVNDFIVQIASGQNALVAFGQQGSQLAGIFGTKGALYGALIAAVSAIANVAWGMWQAHTGVKQYEEALEKLPQTYDDLNAAQEILAPNLSGPWKAAAESVRDYYSAVEEGKLGDIVETGKMLLNKKATMVQDILERFGLGEDEDSIAEQIKTHLENNIPQSLANVRSRMSVSSEADPAQSMAYSGAQQAAADGRGVAQKGFMHHVLAQEEASILARKKMLEVVADEFLTLFDDRGMSDIGLDDTIGTVDDLAKRILDMRLKYSKMGEDAITAEIEALIEKLQLEKYIDAHAQEINRMASAASQQDFNDRKRWAEALAEQGKKGDKAREKYEKDRLKSQSKAFLLQQKQAAIRLKAGIAAAKKLSAAQEKAAEGGAKVQLRYQNQVLAAAAAVAKAEGKLASAQTQEETIAAKMAEEQVRAQYENLRLKNGQLQLTEKQTVELEKQVRLARAAAASIVTLKYAAAEAAEKLADNAEAARELATQLERAARAYETFLNRTLNLKDTEEGIRKQIEVLQKGGSTQDAAAQGRYTIEMKKIQREADALREQQNALGPDRTKTDVQITKDQLDQERKQRAVLKATKDLNAELEKRKGKGGKTPKGEKDPLVELQNRLNLQTDLLGMTEAQGQVYKALGDKYSEVDREVIKSLESQIEYNKMVEFGTNQLADGLTSIVDGTKSVKEAFKDMARELVAQLYKVYVMERLVASIGGYIGGMGSVGSVHANGNVFNSGSLVPYANGGIVAGPTTFPMSGGKTGLMGEAGPEAIMPLKRGANGKLGVQAEGGSGGDVIIHQNFNFQANGDESVKKIIAQQAPAIANMTKKQILDDRRRGGQMKQAFG